MKALEIYEQAYKKYIKERNTDKDWTVKAMHDYARIQIEKDREETIRLHILTSNGELAKRIRTRPINLD